MVIFWERHYLADGLLATNEHDKAIEAKRYAAVRRRAKMQCAQQMAEEGLSIFRADAERFEHFLLQFWLVNSNAAAADLHAIEHDVVGLGANLWELLCLK